MVLTIGRSRSARSAARPVRNWSKIWLRTSLMWLGAADRVRCGHYRSGWRHGSRESISRIPARSGRCRCRGHGPDHDLQSARSGVQLPTARGVPRDRRRAGVERPGRDPADGRTMSDVARYPSNASVLPQRRRLLGPHRQARAESGGAEPRSGFRAVQALAPSGGCPR